MNLEIKEKFCQIYIMQNNTELLVPDYNYILIDKVKYPLLGDLSFLEIFNQYPIEGIVSGNIRNESGHMPNPTKTQNVFEITNFVKTDVKGIP